MRCVPQHLGSAPYRAQTNQWMDKAEIIVPANRCLEYKFYLEKDEKLDYKWNTPNGELYFYLHGGPDGDKTG